MTQNTISLELQLLGVLGGALALLIFGVFLALPHRAGIRAGSRGHRRTSDEGVHEEIRPDGYIDSFGREIEEAGGGLPLLVKLAFPGILLWWLLYLVLNWTSR
jgi:hypothetical protein